jgi:hypothetical protein
MPAPTKPTIGKPDFATSDVIDPSSGQPNVVEPSAGKKANGWIYNEKPPRQYFNWLHRATTLWVTYLDAAMDWLKSEVSALQGVVSGLSSTLGTLLGNFNNFTATFETGTFQAKLATDGTNTPHDFAYTKVRNLVTLSWKSITIDDHTYTGKMTFADLATNRMPASIRPTSAQAWHIPCGILAGGGGLPLFKPTYFEIQYSVAPSSNLFSFLLEDLTDPDPAFDITVMKGSVSYIVDMVD